MIPLRLAVEVRFLSEEIQGFLHPADVGAGRFDKIGVPAQDAMCPIAGAVDESLGICDPERSDSECLNGDLANHMRSNSV